VYSHRLMKTLTRLQRSSRTGRHFEKTVLLSEDDSVRIYLARNKHDVPNTAALLLTDASGGQRYNLTHSVHARLYRNAWWIDALPRGPSDRATQGMRTRQCTCQVVLYLVHDINFPRCDGLSGNASIRRALRYTVRKYPSASVSGRHRDGITVAIFIHPALRQEVACFKATGGHMHDVVIPGPRDHPSLKTS
jgi:hypothetical protein